MKHPALIAFAGAVLMACASPAAPQPPAGSYPVGEKDTCGAAQYASLIGKPESDPAVPAASRMVRRIHPGDMVTMDFSAGRLDIDIDKSGVITGLRCG